MPEHQAVRAAMLREIDLLPQRRFLEPANIDRWIDTVLRQEPDRALWHVERLKGIGGSEIAPLVLDSRGEFSALGSAWEVCAGKLMVIAPMKAKANMRRGTDTEPLIRKMFLEQTGAQVDERALETLRHALNPKVPWMRGTPDDVVLIGGRRIMIDYKSPGEDALDEYARKEAIPLQYACQVHQYRSNSVCNDIPIDAMLLVSLDWVKWELDIREIEFDPRLESELIAVGDYYWREKVLKGELPERRAAQVLTPPEADRAQLEALANEFLLLKIIAKRAEEQAVGVAKRLTDQTQRWRLGAQKLPLAAVDIASSLKVDEEEVLLRLERQSIAADQFLVADKLDTTKLKAALAKKPELAASLLPYMDSRMDWDAAIAALEKAGEDVTACRREEHSAAITRKKSGLEAEIVSIASRYVGESIEIGQAPFALGEDIAELRAAAAARAQAEAQAAPQEQDQTPTPRRKRAAG